MSTAIPDGRMLSGVLILTDHPYPSDEHSKWEKALVGRGGSLMGRAFSRKGWTRDTFAYRSLLNYVPDKPLTDAKGRLLPWARPALDAARPSVDAAITALAPKVIITLGEVVTREVTGVDEPLLMMHGYGFWHAAYHAWVVPTFHPEKLCQGQNHLTQVFLWDVAKAVRMAAEGYSHEQPECVMDPPLREWEAYVGDYCEALQRAPFNLDDSTGTVLALDIETEFSKRYADDDDEPDEDVTYNIERVSFAYQAERGVSVPWAMPYLIGIDQMVRETIAAGLFTAWNRDFDRPRVAKALGVTIPMARTRDSMTAWHVLYNALPKKLGFATSCLPSSWRLPMWKHLNTSDAARYSALDAITAWRNDADIMRQLALTGALDIYHLMCRDLDPVLEEMVTAGLLVDAVARQQLHEALVVRGAELQREMEAAVPVVLRRTKVWKTRRAAEKGIALMIAAEELDSDATLCDVIASAAQQICGVCGLPATKSHTTRKFVKELTHG